MKKYLLPIVIGGISTLVLKYSYEYYIYKTETEVTNIYCSQQDLLKAKYQDITFFKILCDKYEFNNTFIKKYKLNEYLSKYKRFELIETIDVIILSNLIESNKNNINRIILNESYDEYLTEKNNYTKLFAKGLKSDEDVKNYILVENSVIIKLISIVKNTL
jgi:hypothetical protein